MIWGTPTRGHPPPWGPLWQVNKPINHSCQAKAGLLSAIGGNTFVNLCIPLENLLHTFGMPQQLSQEDLLLWMVLLQPIPREISKTNPWAESAKALFKVAKGEEVYIPTHLRTWKVVDILPNRCFKPQRCTLGLTHSCFLSGCHLERRLKLWGKAKGENPGEEDWCLLVDKVGQSHRDSGKDDLLYW